MNKKMKKSIMFSVSALSGFVLTILIVMLLFDHHQKTFRLNKLVKHIKADSNYIAVSKYYNLSVKATKTDITINFSNDSVSDSVKGTLQDNILTFTIPKDDSNILLKGKLLYSVADSIGIVNGNDKGYVSSLLGSLDYKKLNLRKNGIEIYANKKDNIYQFKLDKKFTLGSVASVYFTKDDFLEAREQIVGEDYFQTTKGNLIFYKVNLDGVKYMYIGEPNGLTTRTYNSLISLISVIYDDETAELYSKANSELKTTNYNNIETTINYEVTDDDVIKNSLLDNYKVLKIEIKG